LNKRISNHLYNLIDFFKKLQERNQNDLRLIRQGIKIKDKNKKYQDLDKEIKFHGKQYQNREISSLDFLDLSSVSL